MNRKLKFATLWTVALALLVGASYAIGHPVSLEHVALAEVPLAIPTNVLELFKGANIRFKKGVDPEAAIRFIRELTMKAIPVDMLVQKAFVQPGSATSGLAQYDLEQGARLLYPITTPLRNMVPRMTGGVGIQANWRSVTAVNPGGINIGLSEGHRGAFMSQTVTDNTAQFKTSGMDNYVTEQAYLAGVTFEDLVALASTTTLQGVMEQEERLDLGGNNSLALGTASTPAAATAAGTGGALADGTYSLICVPLTYMGTQNSSISGGVALPYTRTNADGSTDNVQGFAGQKSAARSVVLNGGGTAQSFTSSVTAVRGAAGYAWYFGASGSELLYAITGYPTVSVTAAAAGTQNASAGFATDTSTFSLNYNGLLTQILTTGSGAYYKDLGGAALTTAGSGTGRCAEIDAALASFFATNRLIPTDVFMNVTDQLALTAIVLTGNTNMAPFFMGGSSDGGLQASTVIKRYTNPIGFGTPFLDVHTHPFMPQGTIMFYSRSNPYPLSNVPALVRKLCRRDYWQVDWPVVTLQRTMGVYFDGVMQMYFPPAFGAITGVKS